MYESLNLCVYTLINYGLDQNFVVKKPRNTIIAEFSLHPRLLILMMGETTQMFHWNLCLLIVLTRNIGAIIHGKKVSHFINSLSYVFRLWSFEEGHDSVSVCLYDPLLCFKTSGNVEGVIIRLMRLSF